MLNDKLNLYDLAYSSPNPDLPIGSGSWLGHQHQARGVQYALRKMIKKAERNNCPVPQGAWELAWRDMPGMPRGR